MIEEIISAAALVLVAVIEAVSAVDRKREKLEKEHAKKHAETREQESRLSMQMMDAALELGLATAAAVEQGKVTAEMKAARIKAERAQAEYETFLHGVAAHQVTKL